MASQREVRRAVANSLDASRDAALRISSQTTANELRDLLTRAQGELVQRLARVRTSGAGEGSFSDAQIQATLEQVRYVLAGVNKGMTGVLKTSAQQAAEQGADRTVDHLTAMDRLFRGVAQDPLSLDTAAMYDRAIQGANASLLQRLSSSPTKGPGIMERYGAFVVGQFEKRLQMAALTRKPWNETVQDITSESSFLQGAPGYWAERIVRTETMGALSRGAWEATREADDELGDVVKILCATFDDRTGADSVAAHGQIRLPDEPFEWWEGLYQHPPNRPNDREIVITHRISWPIPDALKQRPDSEVAARWRKNGRKGSPPARPLMTTVPLKDFGKPSGTQAQKAQDQEQPKPLTPTAQPKPTPKPLHELTDQELRAKIAHHPEPVHEDLSQNVVLADKYLDKLRSSPQVLPKASVKASHVHAPSFTAFTSKHDEVVRAIDKGNTDEELRNLVEEYLRNKMGMTPTAAMEDIFKQHKPLYQAHGINAPPTVDEYITVAKSAQRNITHTLAQQGTPLQSPVYRGMKGLSKETFEKFLSTPTMGLNAVSSFSADPNVAISFNGGNPTQDIYGIVVHVRSAKKALDISPTSKFPREMETLLGKDERFRLVKVTRLGTHEAHLEYEAIT